MRALYRWFKGTTPPPDRGAKPAIGPQGEMLPARLGHYAIERKLGQGGMGVVYAARDERLERTVALKTMTLARDDETARKRFWREARAAASVNHPNICQIYEIGEDGGQLFIAMELLEGAPLTEHLQQGPVNVTETISIGLGMLAALSALHARGIVHRDLKPSNVFLTPHGIKLLDFGLARPAPELAQTTAHDLTRVGAVMGTPRYMAPEQVVGETISTRTDLFAAGAILFEMLAGRPAFAGRTVVEIAHSTMYEQPPALTGPPAVTAVDRVIRRALAKRPEERPTSADEIAGDLRNIQTGDPDETAAMTHAMTRLVVLPFRILRPDPETDFLAFSLPDAITTSLSGIGSLVVRSSATAARFAGEAPDFKVLAAEAGVDRVVMGTLLRSGEQIRAVAQLVEAPGRDRPDVAHRAIAARRSLPAPGRHRATRGRGVVTPALGRLGSVVARFAAQLDGRTSCTCARTSWRGRSRGSSARASSISAAWISIPTFAPAWARLGRCHRVIGKYIDGAPDSNTRAEEAFRRALELNPRLTIAHKLYANLEAEIGQATGAVVRLVREATRHGNDPELFAGLVHACRYCGLYEESLAAHDEAQRLDPNSATSFEQTLLMMGEIDRILATPPEKRVGGGDDGIRVIGLGMAGRLDDARNGAPDIAAASERSGFCHLDQIPDGLARPADRGDGRGHRGPGVAEDPGRPRGGFSARLDALRRRSVPPRGLVYLDRAISRGYFVAPTLAHATQFDALRNEPAFQSLLTDAEAGRHRALVAFREAGGDRLFGR